MTPVPESGDPLGFHFHRKTTIRHLTGLASSVFVALMFSFPALDLWSREALVGLRLYGFLAIFICCAFGIGIFLTMLVRAFRGLPVLEFTNHGLIDRRFLRITYLPYEKIEVFSPPIADLFRPSLEVQAVRAELEMGDYVMIMCRLKPGHGLRGPGIQDDLYSFSEDVRPLAVHGAGSASEMERRLRVRLEGRIPRFEQLYEVEFEEP